MISNIGLSDIFKISPMIALLLTSIFPISVKVLQGNKEQTPEATLIQGLGGLFSAAILLLIVCVLMSESQSPTAFANLLVFDGVTLWVGLIAIFSSIGALLLMYDNPATKGEQFSELVFLTLSSVLGMLILVSAVDLIVVFIGLETMSLALYLMIAMSNEQKLAKEASFKYFILGSFASAIFLYGVSFLFGSTGSTQIPELVAQSAQMIATNKLYLIGIALVTLGFSFKVSIVPFHAWTPDVYQGSPTPHSALMATAVKAVSFAAFLRVIMTKSLISSENLFHLLECLAVITMIVGNVAALIQTNFKRVIAYSSIAHSGYLMVGLITAGIADKVSVSVSSLIFYLIGYSVMTLGAFALVSVLEKDDNSIITIENLSGLAKRRPVISFCLALFLFSLAGIPPTVGFFGKFYIFSAAIGEGLLWLAIWGVLNSVISVYYYLKPVVYMYMKDEKDEYDHYNMSTSKALIVLLAVFVVVLGLFSGPIFEIVEKTFS